MTIIEQLQKEQAYNNAHPLFAPLDDEELGERLQGMFRAEIVEDGHDCLNMIFDNGEHFVYDFVEETMYHEDKIPEDFFIHKHLEKVVYDFLTEQGLSLSSIYCARNEVSATPVIRLVIDRNEKIVYLPNIMLPFDKLRHRGLGLKLISDIYSASKRLGFRLYLSMMVESFYNRMVARGATVIIEQDVVEITDDTFLGRKE